MKTRAAILVEQKKPLVIEEVEVPALKLGQVLVKVLASGICGSQIGEINGVKGPDRFLPHLLGHEGCGTVLEIGEGVRTVKPGDRVVLHWRKGAGLESVTPTYNSRLGTVNAGWVTTFNEHAVISENRVTAVPADFDVEAAALFGCAVTTAFGVVTNNAQVAIGQSVVVFGAGHVGQAVVRCLLLLDCQVVCIDSRAEWLDRLPAAPQLETVRLDEPSDFVPRLMPDDFVVCMTMGHRTDLPVLAAILTLGRQPRYLGVIGSRAKREVLRRELAEAGVAPAAIEPLRCPIGLPIGGNQPGEIAVSVAAEILQIRDAAKRREQAELP